MRARLQRRLQGILLVRLIIASLLLGGMLFVAAHGGGFADFTVQALTGLIVLTYATSAAFGALILSRQLTSFIVDSQLAFDVFLATGFVYLTGGAASFFTTLYGVTILAAALIGSPRAVVRTTVLAAVLYVALGATVATGYVPSPPDQSPAAYSLEGDSLVFVLLANVFGLALVGGLSLRLASGLDEGRKNLRRAEALKENIIESLESGLLTLRPNGQIESANSAAAALLGSAQSALIDQPIARFLPIEVGEYGRGEGEACTAKGESFPAGYTVSPLRAEQGSLIIFADLTEIGELRERADRAARLATLGRVASALAHEIRNPLGSISGSVQLVRESAGLEDEDRALVDLVLREVDRLNGLVSQMLNVARPRALKRSPTRLDDLVDEVLQMARADDAFSGLDLAREGSAPVAELDEASVRQLVWNLLRNAAQASPPQGAIRVALSQQEGSVLLSVEDEGAGVEESRRESLFDVFVSGHDHGIGLGLTVVKQIMDGHGGSVRVKESASGGARFVVEFPYEEPSERSEP